MIIFNSKVIIINNFIKDWVSIDLKIKVNLDINLS